jgi:hypothetical protein
MMRVIRAKDVIAATAGMQNSIQWPEPSDGLTATVSGSFRRSMGAVQEAVYALTDAGVHVLSPADPRVVAQLDDFLFVASDHLRAIKPVQNRHLSAIAASHFLWIAAPDGYIGVSAAMEIGYAVALGVPVYSSEPPADLTLKEYVQVVPGLNAAIALARSQQLHESFSENVLLDPIPAIEAAHADLDLLAHHLTRSVDGAGMDEVADRLEREIITPLK